MTTEQSVKEFWEIVHACLVELYRMPDEKATDAMQRLWDRRANGRRVVPPARNLVYHSQPIHIAIDLAGDEIPSEALWDGYRRLLKRYEPSHEKMKPIATAKLKAREVKSVRHIKQAVQEKVFAGR